MPISTVDPSIPTSPLSHLPPGHPEPTSPHLRSSHLTEKELDAARIHVYLLFYEEHALLWSSIEQHFGEWSEKRLNGAMALLEELDAISIEPAPPPNPWSPEDALVSILHSHPSLTSSPLPLPWPGSHTESPVIPSTPPPLAFGFPVALSKEEYDEEVSKEDWGGGRTPFEKMQMEGIRAEEYMLDGMGMSHVAYGHGKIKNGSGIKTPNHHRRDGSISKMTPLEGEYFPRMASSSSETSQESGSPSASSTSQSHSMSGSFSLPSELSMTPTPLTPSLSRSRQHSTTHLHSNHPPPFHTPSFSSMSIPRTHSLYSLDQLGLSGFNRHRDRMSGIIPATSTPPSSDWPTPVFGPVKDKNEKNSMKSHSMGLEVGMITGDAEVWDLDAGDRSRARDHNWRSNNGKGNHKEQEDRSSRAEEGPIQKSKSEPGRTRSRSTSPIASTRAPKLFGLPDSTIQPRPPALVHRPSSTANGKKKEIRFDLPDGGEENVAAVKNNDGHKQEAGEVEDDAEEDEDKYGYEPKVKIDKSASAGKNMKRGLEMGFLPLL